jgi:6,7-dimethyl-8-ribityllumazine synthase
MNHISTPPSPQQLLTGKIAFIRASWHQDIVDQARIGFLDEIKTHGIDQENIEVLDVPGAYEIPLLAKRLAKSGTYDVIVAVALVVDGGIYAHQFVAGAVVSAMMQVQLEVDVPILSVVLTPQQFDESPQRQKFFFDHFVTKGKEAAQACAMVLKQNAGIAGI